jgi:hypothetical protein
MGWDAFSTRNGKVLFTLSPLSMELEVPDAELARAFAEASEKVKDLTKNVDWLLRVGALDCSNCAEYLKAHTTMDPWREALSPVEVIELSQQMQGSEPPAHADDLWAYWSAREFLRVCAEHGLGVTFSY